jgi:quercetin dioxygenase-like cupin family protein
MRIGDVHPDPDPYPEDYLNSYYRIHEEGATDTPQLLEARYLPNLTVDPHAHEHDEIIYVLEGELIVGSNRLGPGSSVFVPGNTLYSFRTGPNGLRFLNFRPSADNSHILAKDFHARRRAEKAQGG